MTQDTYPHTPPATLSEIAPEWLIAVAMFPILVILLGVLLLSGDEPKFEVIPRDFTVTQVTQLEPEAQWGYAQQ